MRQLQRGFSLIEMMVVISIIILIIALLLPALSRARDHPRALVCLNNMGQLMTATTSYANDNSEHLPWPNWGGNAVDVGGWPYGGWLYSNTNGSLTNSDDWNYDLLSTGHVFAYASSPDIFRCSNDQPPFVPQCGQLTSYNMNGSVCGYGGLNGILRTTRLTEHASDDIILWEVDETGTSGWWWDGSNFPHEGLSQIRHYEGGAVVSLDTHAELMTQVEYYAEEALSPGRLWNAPDTTNGR